jgi:hypothetical protein
MQVEARPSAFTVIWTHIAAYALAAALVLSLYLILLIGLGSLGFYLGSLGRPAWVSIAGTAVLLLVSGMLLAGMQRSLLRRFLPARRGWVILGGLAMLGLAGLEYALLGRLSIPPLDSVRIQGAYATWQEATRLIWRWSLAAGFIAGLPVGLLFGMAQSFLLPWRRRLWWALSALAWGILGAFALAMINSTAVLLAGLD